MDLMNSANEHLRTVAFHTLGCKVNSYETQGMQQLFEEAGYEVLRFSDSSDIYIVNTCTVTNLADRKSRQMLHKARRMNEDAIVVAAGCYVQTSAEVEALDDGKGSSKDGVEDTNKTASRSANKSVDDLVKTVDLVVGNNNKKDIVKIVEEFISSKEDFEDLEDRDKGVNKHDNIQKRKYVLDIDSESEFEELSINAVSDKTRASIKIQDGCNQFCSYCIIPYARGRVRSRGVDSVLAEVEELTKNGYKEVVLTGIHLSSYGIDFADNEDKSPKLVELIVELSKIEKLERIRLSSLEPRIITDEFVKILSKNTKLCPHFHLSLQSGCDKTLKRMNRKYTTEEYKEKCDLLREYFDNPAITTDVIVGFPGESQEDYEASAKFLEDIAFSEMHIFKYSPRRGTVAERMPDQVDNTIKKERSNKLSRLSEKMKEDYMSSFISKDEKVLIEEKITINDLIYQVGHNERYIKIALVSEKDLTNQIIPVTISKQITDEIMYGEIKGQ